MKMQHLATGNDRWKQKSLTTWIVQRLVNQLLCDCIPTLCYILSIIPTGMLAVPLAKRQAMIRLESCEFFSRFSHSLSISPEWQWEKKQKMTVEQKKKTTMASCNVLLSIMALSHRHSLLSYLFDCRSLKITSCFHLAAAKNGRLKKEKHSL